MLESEMGSYDSRNFAANPTSYAGPAEGDTSGDGVAERLLRLEEIARAEL